MPTPLERARTMLTETAKAPPMFASTREAFIMRVSTILEVVLPGWNHREFYTRHLNGRGYQDIDKPLTVDWAKRVVEDALSQLSTVL